ncbi:hypothetical protein SH449x_000625 [Pirellulaceae bacterium SH449]
MVLSQSLFAASDFWMAKWLTPMWFVGVGVAAGLVALMVFLAICFALKGALKGLDRFRSSGALNWVALGITLAMGAGIAGYLLLVNEAEVSSELGMISVAMTCMIGIVVWATLYCSTDRFFGELKALLFEGIGGAMLSVLGAVAVIGIAATPLFDRPLDAFASIPQLLKPSTQYFTFTLPGAGSDDDRKFEKIDLIYSAETLGQVAIESNRRVILGDASEIDQLKFSTVTIEPDSPRYWDRMMGPAKSLLPLAMDAEVFAQNEEVDPAELKITIMSIPPVPEAFTILLFALFVFLFGLSFFLMQGVSPKIAAIALSTAKSELSQPLPKILVVIVALAILLFVFLPFNTFGEDIKLLKDCGIILILVVSIFQAVWSASTSVSEEIEGRTALTLLSKPIHRRSFIIGKILGIGWLIMLMFLILGSVELFCVAFKPIYEARENSKEAPVWQVCHFEMLQTVPGLGLAFLECLVLGAISVAIGTRVSLLTNLAVCASLYVLGHLTPVIMESAAGGLPLVEFFSQLISAVVPNLNLFSMEAAIDAEVTIPWVVIASLFIYTAIYGVGATLLGLLLFEDRDLA